MSNALQTRCPRCLQHYRLPPDLAAHHQRTPFVCRVCHCSFDPFLQNSSAPAAEAPPRSIEYFNPIESDEPDQIPIRNPFAIRSILCAALAVAGGIAAGLIGLNPYLRPPALLAVALAGAAAIFFGIRARSRGPGAYIDSALSIFGIGLGALSIVAAIILF